jgi:hypothetical protein
LVKTAEALSGTPEPILARTELLAGETARAEERATRAQPGVDWSSVWIDFARLRLKAGLRLEAKRDLERIPAGLRDGCDALLARRDVAGTMGDDSEREITERALSRLAVQAEVSEILSTTGSASLCLDPSRPLGSNLEIEVRAASPAIVAYGWDGARVGTKLVSGSQRLLIPLAGRAGARTIWMGQMAGGPIEAKVGDLGGLSSP